MLEPWLAHARECVGITFDLLAHSSTVADNLWISWSLRTDGVVTVEEVEAMELLELFARVDYETAWKTLLEMANNVVFVDQVLDAAAAGRVQTIRWLLFTIDPEEYSPTFYAVRQMLLQCWADRHHQGRVAPFTRGLGDRIQLKLCVDLESVTKGEATRMLEEIATVARLLRYPSRLELYSVWQESWGRHVAKAGEAFAVESIYLVQDMAEATDAMLGSIQGIGEKYGVRMEGIELGALAGEALPQITRDFFKSVLLSETDVNTLSRLLLCTGMALREFCPACSAIVTSPSIQDLDLDLPDEDQDHSLFWLWIYSVFSAEATHTIKHVDLNVSDLKRADVQYFKQVLNEQDPLVHLGHVPLRGSSARNADRASSVVEIVPRASLLKEQTELKTEHRTETLRVVHDSPGLEHVAVVYPGAGICWIHRSEIIARREISLPNTTSIHSLQYLTLSGVSSTSVAQLTRLLKPIASGLQTLCITGDAEDMELKLDGRFFSRLFAACPGLRRLDLTDIKVVNFKWLESHGTTLTSLSLDSVESQQRGGYKQMLKIVGSSGTHLRQLHIRHTANHLEKLIDDIVRSLKTNGNIQRLLLAVNSDGRDKRVSTAKAPLLEAFHGTTLAGRAAPCLLRSKLAFLSVLSSERFLPPHQNERSARPKIEPAAMVQLDAGVDSIIFLFAALSKRRVCGF